MLRCRRQQFRARFVQRSVQLLRGIDGRAVCEQVAEVPGLESQGASERPGFVLAAVEIIAVEVKRTQLTVESRIAKGLAPGFGGPLGPLRCSKLCRIVVRPCSVDVGVSTSSSLAVADSLCACAVRLFDPGVALRGFGRRLLRARCHTADTRQHDRHGADQRLGGDVNPVARVPALVHDTPALHRARGLTGHALAIPCTVCLRANRNTDCPSDNPSPYSDHEGSPCSTSGTWRRRAARRNRLRRSALDCGL